MGRGITTEATRAGLNRAILAIALPAMLANVATALFGLADMWVIGQLGDAAAQGAVEVGARLLMALLTIFNFLRSSTVALAAQAAGRGDEPAQAEVLVRALGAAAAIGAVLLLAMPLVVPFGLQLLGAHGATAELARTYVDIRYWSGLPWLFSAVLTGWLIGRRQVRAVLGVEVAANVGHILLDVALVLGLGFGVAGVAVATLASETAKLAVLAAIAWREGPAKQALAVAGRPRTWQADELRGLLRLNRDLFVRTVLSMGAIMLLTRTGAQQGAVTLAANAIIFELFMLAGLMLDGFGNAAQVLCGEALGARDRRRFTRLVRALLAWGGAAALAITLVYAAAGSQLAASFSTAPEVIAGVRTYLVWLVLLPVAGVASFVLDGVFIGSSWTRAMLQTMAAALVGYVALLWLGRPLGNHGLWLAYALFFLLRAAGQLALLPGLVRRSFSAS